MTNTTEEAATEQQQTTSGNPGGTAGAKQAGGKQLAIHLAVSLETIKQPDGCLAVRALPTARLYCSVRRASLCLTVPQCATVLNIMPDSQVRISTSGQEVIAGSRDYGTQCGSTITIHQTTHHLQT